MRRSIRTFGLIFALITRIISRSSTKYRVELACGSPSRLILARPYSLDLPSGAACSPLGFYSSFDIRCALLATNASENAHIRMTGSAIDYLLLMSPTATLITCWSNSLLPPHPTEYDIASDRLRAATMCSAFEIWGNRGCWIA